MMREFKISKIKIVTEILSDVFWTAVIFSVIYFSGASSTISSPLFIVLPAIIIPISIRIIFLGIPFVVSITFTDDHLVVEFGFSKKSERILFTDIQWIKKAKFTSSRCDLCIDGTTLNIPLSYFTKEDQSEIYKTLNTSMVRT